MNSVPVIELDRLTKRYGDVTGILDLAFDVHEGEIFALLGPNGAGKTTTVRLLLDFIRPTSGSAKLFGMDPRRDGIAIRGRIGYLPGDFVTYNYMTGEDVASYFASLRGQERVRFDEMCQRFELDPTRRIKELSKGNRQKVGLMQAFMNDPDLVVLDEPTTGLDPLLQKEFQNLILDERRMGKTVLLSSHVLSEVEATADRVCIIRNGTSVALNSVSDLTALNTWLVEVEFADSASASEFEALADVHVIESDDHSFKLNVAGQGAIDRVVKAASLHQVVRLESHRSTLEDVVLTMYEEDA